MKLKLVVVFIIVLIITGCNVNNSSEELDQKKSGLSLNNNILSGYEKIDSLVIEKKENGHIKKIYIQ